MLQEKHTETITSIVDPCIKGKKVQVFLFGSSVRKERFGDFDIGLMGEVDAPLVRKLKNAFEESTIPYKVDVVDFNHVAKTFRDNVFKEPIIWIKR